MKKLLAFILALSLLCMGGVALADGETLVIYSARNERLNNIVIPAFEAKTGIKVEMITGSSGEVLQRVKSEVKPATSPWISTGLRTKPCWPPTAICSRCTYPPKTTR